MPPKKDIVIVTIPLERSIAERLDLIFWDPLRKKPRYGKRAALINQLLRRWLNTIGKQPLTEAQIDAIGEGE